MKLCYLSLGSITETPPLDGAGCVVRAPFTIEALRRLCDHYAPLYRHSEFRHGYVIAARATVEDWRNVNRPNFMLSLPVRQAALVTGHNLLFHGVNVFFAAYSLSHYEKAMKLYLRAVEDRDIHDKPLRQVRSIIGFDAAAIDEHVNARLEHAVAPRKTELKNVAAIALVTLAFRKYARYFHGDSWRWLAEHGAMPQSIMLTVSGAADPLYYVDALAKQIDSVCATREQCDAINRQPGDEPAPAPFMHAGQVLRDLGLLGLHLDEIGDLLAGE